MNSVQSIMLVLALATVALADPINYKDCGSKGGISNIKFDVSNCAKFPCVFSKNTNASVTISFTTS
jgi:hypothetical protein